MDQGRRCRERLFEIDHRRQGIDVDDDVGERVLGEMAALRHHHRQGLADMAHLVLGERHLGAQVEGDAGDRRRRHQQRPGLPVVAEIVGGIDGDDAGALARGGDVDPADASMGDRAAQERHMHHAREHDVVDEQRPAAQQPRILVALDRGAEISRRHGDTAPELFTGRKYGNECAPKSKFRSFPLPACGERVGVRGFSAILSGENRTLS